MKKIFLCVMCAAALTACNKMFFPGTYNEQELILFNEIKDDNYYRAFRLVK